jgi:NAD(P)-dependent dehydrogenase (short-subunit alcohol dehydrogenase family)
LADEGADVAILDLDLTGAEETARMIGEKSRRSLAVKVDLAQYDDVCTAFQRIVGELGPVDVLVCCAAITDNMATIEKMSVEAWNREIAVNLSGAFYCIKQVGPEMAKRKWGRIILISSRAGLDGGYGQCSYAASKAGLCGLAKTAALEYARHGVTTNVVFPSLANTPATQRLPEEVREKIIRKIPTRRLQEPEEVASVVAFIASDQAKSVNGAEIMVTGGIELFVF